MTSIEWLRIQLEVRGNTHDIIIDIEELDELIEQAKEMHKQEIVNTYIIADSESTQEDSEHYALKFYERTYGSKGSDATSEFDNPFMDFAKQYVEQLKTKKD
jgi:hypothetical protein